MSDSAIERRATTGATVLILVGSTRGQSLSRRLAALIRTLRPADQVDIVEDLSSVPYYDGDREAVGDPPSVQTLRQRVSAADLLVLITPEYNGTVPGLLGNTIDWLSRPAHRSVLNRKRTLVLSASPRVYGGIRAAQHLREVMAHTGAIVDLEGLSIGLAHERLTAAGTDPALVADLDVVLEKAIGSPEGRLAA